MQARNKIFSHRVWLLISYAVVVFLVIGIFLGVSLYREEGEEIALRPQVSRDTETIIYKKTEFKVSVARTDVEHTRGLGGRTALGAYEGMLFIFDTDDRYGIWMKDMLIPIDIIWLDRDKKIVHIEKEVSPNTYPTAFYPPVPSKYVLEFQAGTAEREGFQYGDTFTMSYAETKTTP